MRILTICILLLLIACKEKIDKTGVLRVAGNAPFVSLVFTADNIDYRIPRDLYPEYEKHQNKRVRIVGEVSSNEVKADDGSFTMTIFNIEPDSIIILE
ncbi:MAG: hypothetical protein KDD94_02875 [Calditrichaeota bacterium]|nr:hypothetical protein [Calditrichota bacterium]